MAPINETDTVLKSAPPVLRSSLDSESEIMKAKPRMLRANSAYGPEPPWSRPKTGKRISFADENGQELHHVKYSNDTHYTRNADGFVGGKGGCCTIS